MAQTRITNKLGMFDLVKGISMLAVVAGHTFPVGVDFHNGLSVLLAPLVIIGASIIPFFFVMSGYNFRASSMKKCVEQQSRLMLKPYLYTMVFCAMLHFGTRYLLCRSVRVTAGLTWQVLGGFLLALPKAKEIGGTLFYNCGAMWYLIALYLGWIILNAIMTYVPERFRDVAAVASAAAGWLIGCLGAIPFCIPQSLIAAGFMYTGYRIKKCKLYQSDWIPKHWYVFVLDLAICIAATGWSGKMDNMANGVWSLGVLSIAADGVFAVGVLYLLLLLNNVSFPGKLHLQQIGRYSLLILEVHTIEMHGLPWYLVSEKMPGHPFLANMITFAARCVFIWIGIVLMIFVRRKRATK